MEKTSNLQHLFEEQEYILTPEEEEAALLYAYKQEADLMRVKYGFLGLSKEQIEERLESFISTNRNQILARSNSNKHHILWEKENRILEKRQVQERKDLLKKEWTAAALFQHLKQTAETSFQTQIKVNEHTLALIKTMCFFISEDPRFESELKLDLKKGLLFRGRSGLGKTFIPMCLSNNPLRPIVILNILEIMDAVKKNGIYEAPKKEGILYIDDIGTEETPVLHFGTPIHWLKDFIEQYHFHKLSFNKIILSTNLNTDQLEEKYGYRVRSRMREMFNVIDLEGKDLR